MFLGLDLRNHLDEGVWDEGISFLQDVVEGSGDPVD